MKRAKRAKRTPLRLARAQLADVVLHDDRQCICGNCGVEFQIELGFEPCAFCEGCKDTVLDELARCVVDVRRQLPRSKR